jgi:ABC-type bacteriocin/lantibiotic exporter with double-glycine peptidase domain
MISEFRKTSKTADCALQFICLLLLRCPFDAAWNVINAVFLQRAFNAVSHAGVSELYAACVFFGVANLGLFLYNGTVWSIYAAFVVRMEGRLRALLFRKIASLSCEKIEGAPPGDWFTRLNTDVQMPFSRPLHFPHAVCGLTNACVSAVILLRMAPAIFGWVMLFVIPHIIASQLIIARAMPALNNKCLEAAAANTGGFTALIECAGVAALYEGRDYLLERFERSSLAMSGANMKVRQRNAIGAAILPLFGLSGYVTLLAAAGEWIADGGMTFGDLTAAFQYRGGVLLGTMMLINSLVSIAASAAGVRRLNRTMEEKGDTA